MASTNPAPVYGDTSVLPSGLKTVSTFPDLLMILEFVFGGLVWILVASTTLPGTALIQGWVMFVSVTCFVCTTILMILYCAGVHGGKSSWATLDAFYHFIAAMFYLSASVLQATVTIAAAIYGGAFYQENIAAVVFAYLATLVYFIHAVASLLRWKKFS